MEHIGPVDMSFVYIKQNGITDHLANEASRLTFGHSTPFKLACFESPNRSIHFVWDECPL